MRNPASAPFLSRLILKLTLHAGRISGFITRHRGWIQGVACAIALALGFWGWMIDRPPADFWDFRVVVDNLFRTAQLITLQFPTDFKGHISIPLQIARLAVPIVAVLASFQVLIGSITRPARLALLPHTSDHIIVWGSETLTESALAALASRGQQVVIVADKMDATHRDALEGLGLTIVEGDPRQAATIKSLHLSHAAALFLTADDDVTNLNIAMLALPAAAKRPEAFTPLVLAVLIAREDLAVELDTALDGISRRHGVRYHRLCPDRDGVRSELTRMAPIFLKSNRDTPSHVLMVSIAGNWQQTAAQIIAVIQDHPEKRSVLTFIVDNDETQSVERWHKARPELDLLVEIVILTRQSYDLLPSEDIIAPWREAHSPPQLIVVLREDAEAIATALALRRPGNMLGTDVVPILVHQSKEDRLLSSLGEIRVQGRDMTRLTAIGGLIRADSIERILDRKGEEMAVALHAHYLDVAKIVGAGSPAALAAWDGLSENLREANRAAAEHVPILFASAGFQITAVGPSVEPVLLSNTELELLARVEHRRWIADRISRGWRYGKIRNDQHMLHPSLVPYEALSEADREKDRNAVRALLIILAQQGLAIIRVWSAP